MSTVSTHVLDLDKGTPSAGMVVRLSVWTDDGWHTVAESVTDPNGRVTSFPEVGTGRHRLSFQTGEAGNEFFLVLNRNFEDLNKDDSFSSVTSDLSARASYTFRF